MKNDIWIGLLILLVSPCFLLSCSWLHPSRISVQEMKPCLQYRGFSVERPKYHAWYMNYNEQDDVNALFRMDLSTQTHTFVAAVGLKNINRNPYSPEDLADIEKEFHNIEDPQRFELLEYTQRIEMRQNQWCIYYEEKILDRNAPNSNGRPLVGKARGFVCMHPCFNKTVVHAYYSERGLEKELDSEKILNEGEDFLKGITIESEPGEPVGMASHLEDNNLTISEIPLSYIDSSSCVPKSIKISPDCKRMAYVARTGKKWCVIVNGKAEREYDGILQPTPVFSPDSSRLAYAAKIGNKSRAVVDDKEGKLYGAVGPPIFSTDSTRLLYIAQIGNQMCLVVDGNETNKYEGVRAPNFSPDSTRLAYVACSGTKRCVVVDGKEEKRYDDIGTPIFSPDSARLGYAAKAGKKWFVVVNGKEEQYYDDILEKTLIFSPDSKRVAYVAIDKEKRYAVVDGLKQKCCGIILKDSLGFSPDSNQVAYKVDLNNKVSVVVDGNKGPDYHGFYECPPIFSPDSKRMAYVADLNNNNFVVIDGKEEKHYQNIKFPPVFSPDSKRIAYQVKESKTFRGEGYVIVDGKEGKAYETILFGPVFSPDSNRVVYTAELGDKSYVVIDEKEIEYRDNLFHRSIGFETSDELHYLTIKYNRQVILVKVRCEK